MTNALTAKSQRLRRASKMVKMGSDGGISLKAKLGEHLRYSKGIITFYYQLLTRRCSPMSIFGVFEHLRDRQMSIFVAGPWQRVLLRRCSPPIEGAHFSRRCSRHEHLRKPRCFHSDFGL